MTEIVNTDRKPVDLSTGRVLAPGEHADVELDDHDKNLIEDGLLMRVPPKAKIVNKDKE